MFASVIPILLSQPAALAVEGMWLPEQMPALSDSLTEQGLELPAATLADPMAPPLRSIVSLGFCSASFVSPDGLIATNHHCVQGFLQVNSSAENNRARDGFVAADRSSELSAGPGAQITMVEQITDVTKAVRVGLRSSTKDATRERIIRQNIAKLVDTCEATGEDRECRVASFDGGAQHRLIESRVIKDVRIVYAPPNSVGNYGDEIDNWMWPRHSGDFALLRAYVGPDGSSVPYSEGNVPYHPPSHLSIDPTGAQAGEFVMVAGFPGYTGRYRPSRAVQFAREVQYPARIALYKDLIDILRAESERDPEAGARLQAPIGYLGNGLKNAQGMLDGFETGSALQQKAAADKALAEWVAADRNRKRRFLPALARIDAIQAQNEATWQGDFLASMLVRSSDLLTDIHRAWRLAEERERPDTERDNGYRERDVERLKARSQRLERQLWVPSDRALLERVLREVAMLEGSASMPELDAWLADHGGIESALNQLYDNPVWLNTEARSGLYDERRAVLMRSDDPWLTLARAVDAPLARARARAVQNRGAMQALAPIQMQAIREMAAGPVYPDANGTLRITYGQVKGVAPRDGVFYTPHTTVAGVVAKAGDWPFNAPQRLLDAAPSAPESPWADPELGDVPVDFLTDLDTTGGNSGSATLNARGELVGLIFDGTYESMTGDWAYDPQQVRSIHVDIRYLMWMLDAVEGASHIVQELVPAPEPITDSPETP